MNFAPKTKLAILKWTDEQDVKGNASCNYHLAFTKTSHYHVHGWNIKSPNRIFKRLNN